MRLEKSEKKSDRFGDRMYTKSSFSAIAPFARCVGVACDNGFVYVVNTKRKDTVLEFTPEEWKAFIHGVKAGEFDFD